MNLSIMKKALCASCLFALPTAYAANHVVDVLVVYDEAVATVTEGRDMPVTAASFIEYANQAYRNSGVNIELRLVHLEKVSVQSAGNVSSAALNNLRNNPTVANLRTQYGADLVSLLTLRSPSGGGYLCGIGYIPYGSNGVFGNGASGGGFSVSSVNCGNATFAHELGHNMGLGHSYVQGSVGGIYEWGRGHGVYNKFSTIMAYPQFYGYATRVQQFSSPDQVKCMGLPCGVSHDKADSADAVTSLNTLAAQLSAFFPTVVKNTTVPTPTPSVKPTPVPTQQPTPKPTPVPTQQPTPKPVPPVVGNLVTNGKFDSLASWGNFWNLSTLEKSDVRYASSYALKVTNRQMFISGPIQTVPLMPGKTYQLNAYAALDTSFNARSNLNAALLFNNGSGFFNLYQIASASIVKGQWNRLASTFTVPSVNYGNAKNIALFFYGPSSGWNFLLDEVAITQVKP